MMKKLVQAILILASLFATTNAHAQWTGQAGLGIVAASGNTDNEFRLREPEEQWRNPDVGWQLRSQA